MASKKYNNDILLKIANILKSANNNPNVGAIKKIYGKQALQQDAEGNILTDSFDLGNNAKFQIVDGLGTVTGGDAKLAEQANKLIQANIANQDVSNGVGLGQLGKLAGGAISAHPLAAAGLGGLGALNVGGLTDGNGIGGQVAGTVLGAVPAFTLMSNANPYAKAAMVMGGGALGSLFDKLRAKQEAENKYSKRY